MKHDPPVTGTAKDEVVNVRGQPNFVGEVVGHLKKGETVTVYETISVNSHGKDEPSKVGSHRSSHQPPRVGGRAFCRFLNSDRQR